MNSTSMPRSESNYEISALEKVITHKKCSAVAIASFMIYVIKRRNNGIITKTKLQAMLAYAYEKFALKYRSALFNDEIRIMHFGVIVPSIAELFSKLKHDENITPKRLSKCLDIDAFLSRRKSIKAELGEEAADELYAFLLNIINEFEMLNNVKSWQKIIYRKSFWGALSNKKGGAHLMPDREAFTYKDVLRLESELI